MMAAVHMTTEEIARIRSAQEDVLETVYGLEKGPRAFRLMRWVRATDRLIESETRLRVRYEHRQRTKATRAA